MSEPARSAADESAQVADRFAEARVLHPHSKLVRFVDRRLGYEFIMHVPPGSPWHELLPPEQTSEIHPPNA